MKKIIYFSLLICILCGAFQLSANASELDISNSLSPYVDGVKLSCIQFFIAGAISLVPALIYEGFDMNSAQLILQNYENVNPAVFEPYEVRVYLWEK